MNGLALALARRIWFVPDVMIWGRPAIPDVDCLMIEEVAGSCGIYYNCVATENSQQRIDFASLTDHRGNQLPASITAPRVIIRPKTAEPVFLIGNESSSDFSIARSEQSSSPVPVDLLVIEMGD